MTQRTLKICHVFPPIPTRQFDWMVYDDDEADDPEVVGWGSTEVEALVDYANELAEYQDKQTPSEGVSESEKKLIEERFGRHT